MAHSYRRPSHGNPTPSLLVGNWGVGLGLTEADIWALFHSLGLSPVSLTCPQDKSHCFATFDSAATAAAARSALHGTAAGAALAGRQLTVRFADVRQDKVPGDGGLPPQPAALTAEGCGVPGLALYPEFVSREEEAALLQLVDGGCWQTLAKRRVQHYGFQFEYETRGVDRSSPKNPIPPELAPVVSRIEALPGAVQVDQLTVNEYPCGVGLSPHVDTHSAFTGAIVSLSLAGPAAMVLRRGGEQRAVALPPRSLLVMAGEARYGWQHYVPHRKSDELEGGAVVPRAARRVSLTFRQVRGYPCDCTYPELCDSQQGALPPTRMALLRQQQQQQEGKEGSAALTAAAAGGSRAAAEATVEEERRRSQEGASSSSSSGSGGGADSAAEEQRLQQLEDRYVNGVYNAIAPHFSATRFAVWPKVRAFIDSLPPGAVVADVGCGNGKYFGVRRDLYVLGSDRSKGLAEVAARRLRPDSRQPAPLLADVAVADALCLPLRPGCCDAALCIAVLHHLASVPRRLRLLAQLLRALRPGGRALVTVWATHQEDERKLAKWQPFESSAEGEEGTADYLVPWHVPLHRAEAAAAATLAEARLDSGKGAVVFQRLYHLFGPGELEGLVAQLPGAALVEAFYDRDNWCAVFERCL